MAGQPKAALLPAAGVGVSVSIENGEIVKKLSAVLLVFLASLCDAQMPSKDQLIGEALKDFGNVSGGLSLDQQCHVLSDADGTSFKDNVAFIKTALASDLGDSNILEKIQTSAHNVATSDKYKSCGADVQSIIKQTAGHASNWGAQIKKIKGGGST